MKNERPASEARSVREALAAELLGELDDLVLRVEGLRGRIDALDGQLQKTATTLTAAHDAYRLAVTEFSDAAKNDLQEYVQRQAGLATAKAATDHKVALDEVARQVFRNHALDEVERLAKTLRAATARAPAWHGAAAAAAGGAAGALLLGVVLKIAGLL